MAAGDSSQDLWVPCCLRSRHLLSTSKSNVECLTSLNVHCFATALFTGFTTLPPFSIRHIGDYFWSIFIQGIYCWIFVLNCRQNLAPSLSTGSRALNTNVHILINHRHFLLLYSHFHGRPLDNQAVCSSCKHQND